MNALEQLGRAVADAQDAALGRRDDIERARRRLLTPRPAAGRRAAPPWRRRWPALAAAAVAVLVLGLWLSRPAVEPLSFELADTGQPGTVAEWITAPAARDVPLRFSDGSSVLVGGGSRARVEALTVAGATVQLERGELAVSVARRPGARWRFHVGPFDVEVTGTRFDSSWQAAEQVFSIAMHDGSVLLRGPSLEPGRALVAGQRLRVDLRSGLASGGGLQGGIAPAAPGAGAGEAASSKPANEAARPATGATAGPSAPAADGAAEPGGWQQLARDGRYREAFAAASSRFDAICGGGSAAEVMMLGDAALYAGDAARARQAYQQLRSRFAGSGAAALAAFKLGRLAWGGGVGQAIRWFRAYLREAPSGPLAREALGRIMEAQSRQGSTAAAKITARRYLAFYPRGPHAKLAHKLVGP